MATAKSNRKQPVDSYVDDRAYEPRDAVHETAFGFG
jgi:hypothetical protein